MSRLQQCRVLLYAFCMCRVSLERKYLLPCVKRLFSQAYTREQFNEICRELCDGYPTLKDVKKTVYWVSGYILNNSLQNFHNCFALSSSPPLPHTHTHTHTQYITGYSQRSAHTALHNNRQRTLITEVYIYSVISTRAEVFLLTFIKI